MKKILFLISFLFLGVFLYSQSFDLISSTLTINDISSILKSTSAKDRFQAIKALSDIKEQSSDNILIEQYKKENDSYLKMTIIEILSHRVVFSTSALNVVYEAMEIQNEQISKAAWTNINNAILLDKNQRKVLVDKLKKEKRKGIKIDAVRKISMDTSSGTVKELANMVINEAEDEDVRAVSLKRLKEMNTKDSNKELDSIKKLNIKNKKVADELKKNGVQDKTKEVKQNVKKKS
ncbi:MAG: hypothetical protein AB1602_00420 [Elusimicrobiota bacterium]